VKCSEFLQELTNYLDGALDDRTKSELEDHLNPGDTEKTLLAVIGWARYAELFTYDDKTRTFAISNNSGR
jgi:NitT/TauT family transport system ATP-binding protein